MKTSPAKFSDAAKLLRIEDKRDRLIFACGFFLGLRGNSEMCSLTWGDLMKDDIEIFQPKTGKVRSVRVNRDLRRIISECYEGQDLDDYVFTGRRGQPGKKPLSNKGLNDIIRKHLRLNDIKLRGNDSSHFLRKTYGRNYYENNGRTVDALRYLQKQFGHSSIDITLIYIGVDYDEQAKRVENISYV